MLIFLISLHVRSRQVMCLLLSICWSLFYLFNLNWIRSSGNFSFLAFTCTLNFDSFHQINQKFYHKMQASIQFIPFLLGCDYRQYIFLHTWKELLLWEFSFFCFLQIMIFTKSILLLRIKNYSSYMKLLESQKFSPVANPFLVLFP